MPPSPAQSLPTTKDGFVLLLLLCPYWVLLVLTLLLSFKLSGLLKGIYIATTLINIARPTKIVFTILTATNSIVSMLKFFFSFWSMALAESARPIRHRHLCNNFGAGPDTGRRATS